MKLTNTLAKRIGMGFILIALILALAVGISATMITNTTVLTERLADLRIPTARQGLTLLNGINQSVSALRGYILLKKDSFLSGRVEAWEKEIRPAMRNMKILSDNWTDPQNMIRFEMLEPMIKELDELQEQTILLADTDDKQALALMDSRTVALVVKITDVLNLMVDSQEHLMNADLTAVTLRIKRLNYIEWMLLLTGIVASTVLSLLITRNITSQVSRAVEVADNIANGNLDARVEVGGVREMERLGSSLKDMCDILRQKNRETERFQWISTGQNQLSEIMRRDQHPGHLSRDIICFLVEYTGADLGAVFLHDDGTGMLNLSGTCAWNGAGQGRQKFRIGEGLVGQAAADRKAVMVSGIDEPDVRIVSSMIEAAPSSIFVMPLVLENKVVGVLEIAGLSPFEQSKVDFIELVAEAVALTLASAVNRQKIQDLLEETQRQSEELQAQQEELQQVNEELEEQAELLKQQQEELQVSNQELEEQAELVERKNKDLEAARMDIELKARRLEISSKYKSEFLANMSHELRTPLNSLLILGNDLLANRENNLTEDQLESLSVVTRSGYDLLNLINEILDLAKIESGKMDLRIEKVSTKTLQEYIQSNFNALAQQKGLTFKVECGARLPDYIKTDRTRLEQIIKNLVSNAVKFTSKGEVTVHLGADAGNNFILSVSDTGIGIEKDKQAIIFEAFQQADGSISRKYGGTGLGLSISRELVQLLGGKLSVESEPKKGAVFTMSVPISIDRQRKKRKAEEVALPSSEAKVFSISEPQFLNLPAIADERDKIGKEDMVILIIEDDAKFAQILANKARDKGFKFIAAASGEDGLILAGKYVPHAVILDLDLPGIDGRTVLQELKNDPALRHIPVHIMSVEHRTIDPFKSGAVEFLTKPVTKEQMDDVFVRIQDFINRKMKNLLIIEDDSYLRRSIIRLIGNGDVQCFEAGTAEEALKVFEKVQVDCMVLDLGLPDMSGFELVRELEKKNKNKIIPPIIVYTGRDLTKQENEELQQYAETVIVKGVKSEERLLDETALFLHRTVKNLPREQQQLINGLYDKEAVFQKRKVLLVDDDMRNVFALSKVLSEKGMQVVKAENGHVALAKLEQEGPFDIVLMDIMMPEMDGYACIRNIRKQRKFRDIPIVALTAKAMKDDRQMCIDAGANDYIAKPIDLQRLLSLIRVWIKK